MQLTVLCHPGRQVRQNYCQSLLHVRTSQRIWPTYMWTERWSEKCEQIISTEEILLGRKSKTSECNLVEGKRIQHYTGGMNKLNIWIIRSNFVDKTDRHERTMPDDRKKKKHIANAKNFSHFPIFLLKNEINYIVMFYLCEEDATSAGSEIVNQLGIIQRKINCKNKYAKWIHYVPACDAAAARHMNIKQINSIS